MPGARAGAVRVDVSAPTAAAAAVRSTGPGTDAPVAANPRATPTPKVYRPVRANLYSRAQGGGSGRAYREVGSGFFSINQGSDADGGEDAVPTYPLSDRLEHKQATISYSVALHVVQTLEDRQTSINDVVT